MQLHVINNYTYISQVCLLGLGIFITVIGRTGEKLMDRSPSLEWKRTSGN